MNASPRFSFRLPNFLRSVNAQIFVTFFVIYAITSSGGLEVTDSEARYRTAQSWLNGKGGVLDVSLGPIGVPIGGGHQYSFYGPLQSIIMTPVVALVRLISHGDSDQLFKLAFGVIAVPFISAFSLVILYNALRALRFDERTAFYTVAVIGLATPLWHYGRSGQEENIIGLAFGLYLWGIGQLFRERYGGVKLVALSASIVVATRWSYLPTLLIILIPVALLLWQKRADWRFWWGSLAVSGALGSAVVAAVFWYNAHRFGSPLETGYGIYYRLYPPFFTLKGWPSHVAALLVSPYRGILWFSPSILVLIGLRNTPKGWTKTAVWKATVAAWVFTVPFIASFAAWNAGPAWAPRYLVALLVLLAPAFASVFAAGQRWHAVIAISIVVQFCSTLLPSASEDAVSDARNAAHPGTCTPWSCGCSALCMRGPWALRVIANTITSRPLPVVELTTTQVPNGTPATGTPALETSDFNSVYWWPVRAAYRAHRFSPALAFAVCMLILTAALGALRFFYQRLPEPLQAAMVSKISEP